jgi:hypothetical protein
MRGRIVGGMPGRAGEPRVDSNHTDHYSNHHDHTGAAPCHRRYRDGMDDDHGHTSSGYDDQPSAAADRIAI